MRLRFSTFFVTVAFLLGGKLALTQMSQEDSLTQQIFVENDPHEKILLMGDLCYLIQYSNPERAIEISKQALALAKTESNQDILYAYNLVGLSYLDADHSDSAMHYLQKTLALSANQKDTVMMSKALNNLGSLYINLGEYQTGLDNIIESGMLDFQMGDKQGAAISYMNAGTIQYLLKDFDASRQNLRFAIDIFKEEGDKANEANCYLSLGALEIEDDNINDGKTHFFRAISLQEEMKDFDGVSRSYNNLAKSFRLQQKFKIALVYDLKSLEYSEKIDSPKARQFAYKGLASTYEGMGDYKSAVEHYRLYMDWRDTVQAQENREVLIEMQERYNSIQTSKENEILQQQNKIESLKNLENEAKLEKSNIIIIASIGGLLLLLGLAFVLFNRNRIKQKANAQLSEAYTTIQRSHAELKNANLIIQEKNDDITASIEYASKIQEALLPTRENNELFEDSFFILKPKDIVSGDFLWYTKVGDSVIFAAADCTGHGVPGAFMSMIGNTFLHQIITEQKVHQPSLILDMLRLKVIDALNQEDGSDARKDGMDMSLCHLNLKTRELQFAGANNPLYYVTKGEILEIKGDKQPVGYMPERDYPFTNHTVQLDEGDALYIFSDGYADQFGGPKGKKFKYKRMRDLLHKNHALSMAEQKQIMLKAFNEWKGELEQIDDVCMIGVRI